MFGRCFIILACAFLLGVVAACGGDGKTPTATPAADTAIATATPGTRATSTLLPTAPTSTPMAVSRTDVITFVPPTGSAATVTGSCFGPSIPVARLGAWRCMASNQIYDPCFGAKDATTVICVRNPARPQEAVQMNLLSRACENAVVGNTFCGVTEIAPPLQPRPWAFKTAQGSICTLQQGTIGQWRGEPVPYGCLDGATILGLPQEGTVWTVRVADATGSETISTIPLVTVWL